MKFLLFLTLGFCLSFSSKAQNQNPHYMLITTVESTVEGGGGRSKLIITDEEGKQQETDMLNLFSLLGINFKNIKANDLQIFTLLNELGKQGWRLAATIPLVPVSSDNSLCMTRYLFTK